MLEGSAAWSRGRADYVEAVADLRKDLGKTRVGILYTASPVRFHLLSGVLCLDSRGSLMVQEAISWVSDQVEIYEASHPWVCPSTHSRTWHSLNTVKSCSISINDFR